MDHLILGLWPVAGVTTIGVSRQDARDTVQAAIELGFRRFDTAFSYGFDGESDRLIGEFLPTIRDPVELIGKVGQRWSTDRKRIIDGSPTTLVEDAETSLRRIGLDQFDRLMLHCPDPQVPLERSAEAMAGLIERGLAKQVGICNADETQRSIFSSVVNCSAIQCPLNLLQQAALQDVIPDASAADCEVHVYWTLMKGLLAGKIGRQHQFAEGDSRPGYAVFQGSARERAHRVLDELTLLAEEHGCTVAQLAIGWTVSQPGVTAALVGARRPDQVHEIAGTTRLPLEILHRIHSILERHPNDPL